MEVVVHDGNKVLWDVVDDHVTEEETYHYEIGLRGFDFNFFDEDEKGVGREGSGEFPYLLMPINLWHVYWNTQLKSMNQKGDEDNVKAMGTGNGQYQKVW